MSRKCEACGCPVALDEHRPRWWYHVHHSDLPLKKPDHNCRECGGFGGGCPACDGLMFPDIRCPLCRSEAITTVVTSSPSHLCQDCDHEWKEPAEAGSGLAG